MKKAIVCKDLLNKKLINCTILDETENIQYELEEVPVIEDREGEIGKYVLSEDGTITVEYEPIPPTELEIVQNQVAEQEKMIADLMLIIAGGGANVVR